MDFKVIRDAKGNLIEDVTLEPYTITKSDNEKDIESVFKNYIEFVGWVNSNPRIRRMEARSKLYKR